MKNFKRFVVALLALVAAGATASAQFHWGPRLGVEINKLHFDESAFASDNRAGFTGGLQIEFTVPIVNLGFDASVMYVHRTLSNDLGYLPSPTSSAWITGTRKNSDYIEIPINFKYKLGLPVIGKIFTPYVFTGPSFAFLTSKTGINEAFRHKKVDIAWNFGIGVQLVQHLQIGASYGLGISDAVEKVSHLETGKIDGKNRYWTVTAAWLF